MNKSEYRSKKIDKKQLKFHLIIPNQLSKYLATGILFLTIFFLFKANDVSFDSNIENLNFFPKELRNAVKKFYSTKYSVEINRDNVFITTGSSGAFLLTFLTCFDESKKVGVFNPVYPAYRNILKSLNIDILEIYPDESDICKIDLRKIEKYKFLDGLIISNPNNPNGQVFSDDELNFIYSFCEKNKIYLILDEIYHGIEYGAKTKSILNFGPNAIVINSFSKYFCLPG